MRRITYITPVENVSGKWAPVSVKAPTGNQTTGYNGANQSYQDLFISQCRRREGNKGLIALRQYFQIKTTSGDLRVPSQAEIETRSRFKAISAQVRAAYADETKLRTYKAQYKAASYTPAGQTSPVSIPEDWTLRKFIWEAEAAIYDQSEP